ncbi:HAMP domain-containing histidine kinase [candidate division KSB1 bacterium]|nr:HAMP domain-containing histidine kinase [candidate division KSB1 bacterium]
MFTDKQIENLIGLFAHKLKNPTHIMGLNLEIIRSQVQKLKNSEDFQKPMDTIHNELNRLNLIIQKFSEYMTPAGQGKKATPVSELTALLRMDVEPLTHEHKIILKIEKLDKDIKFQINSDEVKRALVYLLTNAIEASQRSGEVVLRTKNDSKNIFFEIQDQGTGISNDESKKISNLFYSTKKGHLGVGLTLAIKLIEENGGKVRMKSSPENGTLVIVSFSI